MTLGIQGRYQYISMATGCDVITSTENEQTITETDDFSPLSSAGSVDSGFTENEEGSNGVQDIHKKWGNCPPDSSLLPPCRVCEEKASGWHYGANTCEPCKGFFRRCIVKMKKKEEYKCLKDKKCKLGGGKRMSCSFCRYQKCLAVGMSHDAIKIGRYTHEKRTSNIKEIKKIKVTEKIQEKSSEIYVDEKEVDSLVETLIQIEQEFNGEFIELFEADGLLALQKTVYETFKQKEEIFGKLGYLPTHVYDEFYKATGIDIDNRKNKMSTIASHMDKFIRNMINFARNIPGFSALSTADQIVLLKAGFHEYWFLEFHRRVNPELRVIALTDPANPGIFGAHQSEMSSLLNHSNTDYMFECAASLRKCNLSAEEATLARGIVLTFTDQCTLQEPEKVEKIQWYLVNCLRTVAKKSYKNPDERLWKILDKFTLLRSVSNYGREMDNIKAQWPVMKDHPLVLEIIGTEIVNQSK